MPEKKIVPFPAGKRGEIAVIEQMRSYMTAKMEMKPYRRFYLAKIKSTRRDGLVKSYITTDGGVFDVLPGDSVHVIAQLDKQAAAKKAFESYSGIAVWTTLRGVKQAILNHLEGPSIVAHVEVRK